MIVINRTKWVTIEFAQCLFGSAGIFICAAGMSFSLIGWSALQLHLIVSVFHHSLLFCTLIVLFIYFLTRHNLTVLALASKILLPFLGLSLAYCLVRTGVTLPSNHIVWQEPFSLGVMMVFSAACGLVFDLPTFYRHAATAKDALLSLLVLFLVALPSIEGLGIYLATHELNSSTWAQGFLDRFDPASLFFLILSGILGTCLNLYSAALILSRTLGFEQGKMLMLSCLFSALLAQLRIEKKFSEFLELINLSAEIILVLILIYTVFRGSQLPQPSNREKRIHQYIFYTVIAYVVFTKLFKLSLCKDPFLDTAILSGVLMFVYYAHKYLIKKYKRA